MTNTLNFRKFSWVKVKEKKYMSCVEPWYFYRVYRKYFHSIVSLSNTDKSYPIQKSRWEHLEKRLKENPNFHYTMELWSGNPR